ncbi:DnaJ C-terminal domain-containing protein [Membranihabitans maritimus]|uniref:DnaJ C-terminal domain-containing protein n=1 Tax=Membranihabitans maritimus TaxID=2904244 RepID=UPI001F3371C1|nr:DnaJ C-terminal domain-containing protein [Membranihabitans maritimus]
MSFIDYYKILGLEKTATSAEIKKAYRKLARKYHPDVNPDDTNAEQQFKKLNEAYAVLSDPEKRKKYDAYGENWEHAEEFEKAKRQQQSSRGKTGSSQDGWQHFQYSSESGDFSDFFNDLFGSSYQQSKQRGFQSMRGRDLNAELTIPLTETLKDQKQVININGKKIRITIPAGIKNGQTIKISNQGESGVQGGPNGDLYITFNIQNDTSFTREGDNLLTTVNIDLYTAVLGGDQVITTLNGKVRVKIPPGTQPGEKIRINSKGLPIYKQPDKRGDLIADVQVQIPRNISPEEKSLFQKLATLKR